ncbi:MAG: hypothetical protein J5601_02720 [Elusimicrobiaceae bacterium]|nr:hypothetical protein [Elusimicrobiaceae bacterium]
MTDTDKLEVIKHSYEILKRLVKRLEEQVKDAQDGIKTSDRNLIMGSLHGINDVADRIKNLYGVMMYLHQERG